MNVAILTIEQKDILTGKKFSDNSYFSPVKDLEGNWVISEIEINKCNDIELNWLNDLEITIHKPVVFTI